MTKITTRNQYIVEVPEISKILTDKLYIDYIDWEIIQPQPA